MLSVAAIAVLLVMAAGCTVGPTEEVDQTFPVGDSPSVIVDSDNSEVEVRAGDDGEVRVQATLRDANKLSYEVSQEGDTITVEVEIEGGFRLGTSPSADLTITVPASTDVEIRTSNGAIELRGIEGTCSLRSSNGRVSLKDVKGDFEGGTSNGRIEIEDMAGTADLNTSNGQINAGNVTGVFDLSTSNGKVIFSGELTAGGSNRLVSSNGDVTVELEGTPSVSLEAETSNGKVKSELEITATVTGDKHLVGTIGDGEADLYVRTSNGDVTIK
jgi:DUF4097 and DUF4098 domain-containing protein YvlB